MQLIIKTIGLGFIMALIFGLPISCSNTNATISDTGANKETADLNAPSQSSDRCNKENKEIEIDKIQRAMRDFDDLSILAQSIPREQLVQVVLALYQHRADARAADEPDCLTKLHETQIKFMDSVIITMNNFLTGASGEPIAMLIGATRQLRVEFEVELGNQLGYEYLTPTPFPTPTNTPVLPTSTPTAITTYTEQDIFILDAPSMNAQRIGTFLRGQLANVLSKSADSTWIVIEVNDTPGQRGWVPINVVRVNGNLDSIQTLENAIPTATLPILVTNTP